MKLDVNMLKENAEEVAKCKKIEEQFELDGNFNSHTNENSMEGYEPVDENFPYIKKGLKSKIKHFVYLKALKFYTNKVNKQLTNLKVEGKENLKGVKGAVVTCNHISKVDSFAVRKAVGMDIMYVAAAFNNWKGFMGDIGRNTGYIPLPLDVKDLKMYRKFSNAIQYYLNKNKKILIYPEQAMWRDYKKPRPYKNGAFHFASKNNKPILPLFITIEDKKEKIDSENRVNFGDYTIHILKPIYPKPELSEKENTVYLRQENYRACKEVYEKTYNKKLEYTTLDKSKIEI